MEGDIVRFPCCDAEECGRAMIVGVVTFPPSGLDRMLVGMLARVTGEILVGMIGAVDKNGRFVMIDEHSPNYPLTKQHVTKMEIVCRPHEC